MSAATALQHGIGLALPGRAVTPEGGWSMKHKFTVSSASPFDQWQSGVVDSLIDFGLEFERSVSRYNTPLWELLLPQVIELGLDDIVKLAKICDLIISENQEGDGDADTEIELYNGPSWRE